MLFKLQHVIEIAACYLNCSMLFRLQLVIFHCFTFVIVKSIPPTPVINHVVGPRRSRTDVALTVLLVSQYLSCRLSLLSQLFCSSLPRTHVCILYTVQYECTQIYKIFLRGSIDEGYIQKARQRPSLLFRVQNLFNSLPR